ncbi:MAG: prolipoprotein diacylglyceryl transferase [Deltaproteobacteria bacterium]|nr:prolipoprotein diacylglyceryl transferase [Deltaproteobacteria bacterium]
MPLLALPYFTLGPWPKEPLISIGSFHLQIPAFGLLVFMGIVIAILMGNQKAKRMGLSTRDFQNLAFFLISIGFLVSHLFEVLFYHPEVVLQKPWILLDIFNGLSSYGGLIGGIFAFLIWTHWKHIQDRLAWADLMSWCFAIAFFFGRIGCSVAHDHPGALAPGWPLAIQYADPSRPWLNGPRHDLGFYEAIWWLVILIVMFLLDRKPRRQGFHLVLLALLYAPVRFALDFLRIPATQGGDIRYFGLTPAQYLSLVLLGFGIYFWFVKWRAWRTGK